MRSAAFAFQECYLLSVPQYGVRCHQIGMPLFKCPGPWLPVLEALLGMMALLEVYGTALVDLLNHLRLGVNY